MKAKELVNVLEQFPEAEVVFSGSSKGGLVHKLATTIYDYNTKLIYLVFDYKKISSEEVNE